MSIIPALWRQRQENLEFQGSPGQPWPYSKILSSKTTIKNKEVTERKWQSLALSVRSKCEQRFCEGTTVVSYEVIELCH
jgi:hypothetical protein